MDIDGSIGMFHRCCLDDKEPMAGRECYRVKPESSCALRERVKALCTFVAAQAVTESRMYEARFRDHHAP